jgi:long-chain acyl-CoA synthetase
MRKFEKLCPNAIVINGWGMTEVIPPVCASSPSNIRSVGKPVPNVELKIVDPDGNEVKVGEVGELIVRGKSVFCGYYNEPELNNEVFKDGWFYTGDLARKDEEGNYYIIGKSKDTIKVGGQLVWAAEVEEVLLRYPGIREAAAIGVPDELRGEVVKCYIAPVDSIDLDKNELMEYLRNNLAKFKLPKDIIILNELPKTGSGKVNKAALQEFN